MLVRLIHSKPLWQLFRRTFAGIVLLYIPTSWFLGETSIARPVYFTLTGMWISFQIGWTWMRRHRPFTAISQARLKLAVFELTIFNLAFALFLGEYSLRLYSSWSGRSFLVSDAIEVYKLVPGHDYGGGLRGNNFGYPGSDFIREKRPGIRRVAVLGDSFAVGPAVPFADNFLTLLGQELPEVEVYNFGVSSTGPREYRQILQEDVWQFQPDIVIVCVFIGNDITESLATPHGMSIRKTALYQFLNRASRLARERARQPVLSISSAADQFPRPPLAEATFREIEARRLLVCQTPPSPDLEKKWQRALSHLEQIIVDCKSRQVPVGFVLIPDEFQVNSAVLTTALQDANLEFDEVELDLPQRRLRAFCTDRDVPCLDLKPFFQDAPDTYAFHDTHWNVRGNRLAAEKMAGWLNRCFIQEF
jgi:GDSL-like Lipase/Acylhydrolase family